MHHSVWFGEGFPRSILCYSSHLIPIYQGIRWFFKSGSDAMLIFDKQPDTIRAGVAGYCRPMY